MADLAVHVDVGQEVHLDLDRAIARARLAAPALDVEAEAAGLVATRLGFGGLAEQGADAVEDARVGRGVRARRPADRSLVDVNNLVEVVEARHTRVLAGNGAGTVEPRREHLVQDVVDQRRLAGSAHARHGGEHTERELRADLLQVVLAGADDFQHPLLVDPASLRRCRDAASTGEVVAGDRAGVGEQLAERPGVDDVPTVDAGAGPDVDDPVGGVNRLFVVLDDDQSVAQTLELQEGLDETAVVALVQTDRGFVQDVEHAGQARADLRRETDALGLAARERPGGPAEVEVVQTDLDEELEARADLAEHRCRNHGFTLSQLERGKVLLRVSKAQA